MKRRGMIAGMIASAFGLGPLASAGAQARRIDVAPENPSQPHVATVASLAAAYREASAQRRTLTILVISDDPNTRALHGEVLGAFLLHGPRATRLRIAETVVVCATPESIRLILPSAPVSATTWALVVRPRESTVAAPVDLVTPAPPTPPDYPFDADPATYERLARDHEAAVERHLDEELTMVDGAFAAVLPSLRDEAAAAARLTALERDPISGSGWAEGGCGITVEGVDDPGLIMGCGMGSVPPRAQRFVYWMLANDPRRPIRLD